MVKEEGLGEDSGQHQDLQACITHQADLAGGFFYYYFYLHSCIVALTGFSEAAVNKLVSSDSPSRQSGARVAGER